MIIWARSETIVGNGFDGFIPPVGRERESKTGQ